MGVGYYKQVKGVCYNVSPNCFFLTLKNRLLKCLQLCEYLELCGQTFCDFGIHFFQLLGSLKFGKSDVDFLVSMNFKKCFFFKVVYFDLQYFFKFVIIREKLISDVYFIRVIFWPTKQVSQS